MVGRTVSHYRILDRLGGGGMGVVYKAEDTRLKRLVALKFLPGELSRDPHALERFEREAQAASALNHPHICTIYDIDEHDGRRFIAMELLEGQTLKERLQGRPLPAPEIVDVGLQLADALEAAHAKGIIHRDLKPANLFITTRGTVKLLDFGLAKLVVAPHAAAEAPTAAAEWVTGAGVALGTVGYMSPEQVRGEALDARTDLFSLGVVLYEMATGTAPFRGATSGTVLSEILTKAPVAPVRLNPAVPPELERIVNKLLEKDRALRYHSATELRVDLERLRRALSAPAAARVERASIVVLPFENLSADADQEYFCDGITEEIITTLSKIRELRVISRNSAMTLKGARKTARETGALLNVGHVLEGSVRKAGNNLRITAQLIDAATDAHLWAERYAGTLDDVFSIQEQVASSIAEALKVAIVPAGATAQAAQPALDARVKECYRRAWHEMLRTGQGSQASFERAVRQIEQGVETLGEHPTLQVALAQMHYLAVEWGLEPRQELLRVAVDVTRRVEAASPAHAAPVLAKLERFTGSQVRAIRHFEDAIDQDPGDVESLWFLSHTYSYHAGQPVAGAHVANRLLGIDPLTVMNRWPLFVARWMEGDLAGGLAVLDDIDRREPGLAFVDLFRPLILARLGRVDEMSAAADALLARNLDNAFVLIVRALALAVRGEREPLLAIVTGPARGLLWTDSECPEWTAGWLALVGERDLALDWLEHWVDRGSFNYPMLAHGDPLLENLRGEPRFHRLLERVRPVWEAFVPRLLPPGDAR